MGLNKENTFGCLTDFLFRPTIGSRRFINAYRGLFQMESILSIGMQVCIYIYKSIMLSWQRIDDDDAFRSAQMIMPWPIHNGIAIHLSNGITF